MITLFHRPKTRSTRFIFLLEELDAPYQLRPVTTRTRDGGAIDPANPHPHGKVPAISDDGTIVFESPAIALYLTDKFPKNRLGPQVALLLHRSVGTCVHVKIHECRRAARDCGLGTRRRSNARAHQVALCRPLHAGRPFQRRGRLVRHDIRPVRAESDDAKIRRNRGLRETRGCSASVLEGASARCRQLTRHSRHTSRPDICRSHPAAAGRLRRSR